MRSGKLIKHLCSQCMLYYSHLTLHLHRTTLHSQRIYASAKSKAELNIERDASALLLEPTNWNTYYRHLQSFYERNGHCNFKRTVTDADVAGLSEEAEKELRTLSWWTCRQRKNKRRGELEGYKIHLLNRLHFEWNPHAGPGEETICTELTMLFV